MVKNYEYVRHHRRSAGNQHGDAWDDVRFCCSVANGVLVHCIGFATMTLDKKRPAIVRAFSHGVERVHAITPCANLLVVDSGFSARR